MQVFHLGSPLQAVNHSIVLMDPTPSLQKKLSFVQVFHLGSLQKSFPWGTKKGEKPTAEPHNILKSLNYALFCFPKIDTIPPF